MVRCWNCEHLIRIYSGNPRKRKLFENEFRKCRAKGIVFEHYNDITKERECTCYKESKHKIKYEEIAEIREERIYMAGIPFGSVF